jgi:hypothetical protein
VNEIDLFKSIGEVEDTALQRSEDSNKRNWRHRKWYSVAAVAAVLVCMIGIFWAVQPDEEKPQKPWFAVTAYAENGELMEVKPNEGFFNSTPKGIVGNYGFDPDKDLFSFIYRSPLWEGMKDIYGEYDLLLSYNGRNWDGTNDRNIGVFHLSSDEEGYAFVVRGWTDDEADLTIAVYSAKTGDFLEETSIHVRYIPEKGGYELTVSETKTTAQISTNAGVNSLPTKNDDYQLSNEQLKEPTDKLVDIVLRYPYLVDLFCSSGTKDNAYEHLKERFNGLAELEKRSDALSVLQAKLQVADNDTIEAILLERLISIYSKMFPLG